MLNCRVRLVWYHVFDLSNKDMIVRNQIIDGKLPVCDHMQNISGLWPPCVWNTVTPSRNDARLNIQLYIFIMKMLLWQGAEQCLWACVQVCKDRSTVTNTSTVCRCSKIASDNLEQLTLSITQATAIFSESMQLSTSSDFGPFLVWQREGKSFS